MTFDLLILDGRHLLWRSADAFSTLTDGENGTGGVYGFVTTACSIHARWGGKVIVAWEGDRSANWRVKAYPAYKENKRKRGLAVFDSSQPGFGDDVLSPEEAEDTTLLDFMNDMNRQEGVLQELLSLVGVRQFSADGCEADDVMGTIALRFRHKCDVGIYTGDSDLRQCVGGRVRVVAPSKGKDVLYDAAAVEAKHGVPPHLIPDLKALSGDSSDNIPGVVGIGPKKALALLKWYGDLGRVVEAAAEGDPEWPINASLLDVVKQTSKDLPLFKRLATVDNACRMLERPRQRDQRAVVDKLKALRFRSLIAPNELMALMALGA